jgi:LysM repeat protein
MPRGKKLAVVLSVLVAGWSAALFFRKDASEPQENSTTTQASPFNQPVERRVVTTFKPADTAPIARLGRPLAVPDSTNAGSAPGDALGAPSFHRTFNPAAAILHEEADDDDPVTPEEESVAPPADDEPPAQMHKIVDGDTLSKLAQTYLRNAARYLEIYEQNRDVLKSPNLLPIGKTLKIIDQPPTLQAAGSNGPGRMVPIPKGALRGK